MGCASSTPMVATAGSEILKAATHVADDAKTKAEGAVEEVSNTLGKTLETAKDTVGNAVTGITNELGNAFKEQTETLEEVKDKVTEKLHMSDVAAEVVAKEHDARLENLSRSATPNADADSLKTTTPEPEIEQALANHADDDENPPTPKPTLAELAHLSAEAATIAAVTAAAASNEQHSAVAAAATTAAPEAGSAAPPVDKTTKTKATTTATTNECELKRPSTTEWEKFADMLAHNRKFKPYEAYAHNVSQFSVYQDYTRLKDMPGPHYDGSFSDATSSNTLTSLSQSSLSSPHFHHAPASILVPPATVLVPPATVIVPSVLTNAAAVAASKKGYQRDFASLVACEQPGSVSRLSNRSTPSLGRQFDYNPSRERISLPIVASSTTHLGAMVSAAAAAVAAPFVLGKSSSWARQPSDGSIGGQQATQPLPLKLGTLSRSSQSSSNSSGGVVVKSNFTTPSTMSPTLTLPSLGKCAEEEECLVEDRVMGAGIAVDVVPGDLVALNLVPSSGTATPTPSLLRRSRTPTRRPSNTSSFLSSPRVSPFSVRKDYGDKENKATFIADLSSVTPKRSGSKVPLSPYHIRERCDVCYNKYVIK